MLDFFKSQVQEVIVLEGPKKWDAFWQAQVTQVTSQLNGNISIDQEFVQMWCELQGYFWFKGLESGRIQEEIFWVKPIEDVNEAPSNIYNFFGDHLDFPHSSYHGQNFRIAYRLLIHIQRKPQGPLRTFEEPLWVDLPKAKPVVLGGRGAKTLALKTSDFRVSLRLSKTIFWLGDSMTLWGTLDVSTEVPMEVIELDVLKKEMTDTYEWEHWVLAKYEICDGPMGQTVVPVRLFLDHLGLASSLQGKLMFALQLHVVLADCQVFSEATEIFIH